MYEIATGFLELFNGYDKAYGIYKVEQTTSSGKAKGQASTIVADVTPELWVKHLTGKQGIGIIPIKNDNTCYFGAIDIDIIGVNFVEIIKKLKRHNFPFVPCRSKSGGCHLFIFLASPVSAKIMQTKLREMAATLGYGNSEIFPKQIEVLTERGDLGQWINMPYFNDLRGLRYAVNEIGEALSIADFLSLAYKSRITVDEFAAIQVEIISDEITDGPPCLQYLITQGFQEGMRNNGLFNIGVYARKAFPDEWEKKTEEYNQMFMIPALLSSEVQQVLKSVKKKTYIYTCNQAPINAFCNKALCITRKYGIGPDMSLPNLSNLTKFNSNPPIWFIDVEGAGRMELTTEDLQTQERFQRRCIEALNMMPPIINKMTWQQIVQRLLDTVVLIIAPADASPSGQLIEHLERFCTSRVHARDKNEILLGKPYSENTHHYFRMSDFISYLDRHHFKEFKVHKISSIIKEQLKAEHTFLVLKGKGVNVWKVPEFQLQDSDHDVPDINDKIPF
jgi:hypothetical protein